MDQKAEEIVNLLRNMRVHVVTEEIFIHNEIKKWLENEEIEYRYEEHLGKGNRIDFLVGTVGIEVKKGKPNRNQVIRQLERYSKFDKISSLILVIERSMDVPNELNGKPVYVIGLNKLWF